MYRFHLLLVCFWLAGCAAYGPPRVEPARYPYSHTGYDLALFWNLKRTESVITLEGMVQNNSYAYLHDLEVTATILDGPARKLGEDTFLFFPRQIDIDEIVPFTLRLPLPAGTKPATLRFFYRYRVSDRDAGPSPFMHSFEVELR